MDKGECNFRQGIGRLKTQIFVRKHATFESDKLHQSPWPRVVVPQKFIRPRYQMKSGVHNPCYLRENWPWFDVINQKKTAMKIILFCTWKFNHSQECKIVRFFARNHCVFVLRSSRVFCVFIPFSPRILKHHLHHRYTENLKQLKDTIWNYLKIRILELNFNFLVRKIYQKASWNNY